MVQTKKINLKLLQLERAYIDLFTYSIFKNTEILSDQGVVQNEPNLAWSIQSVPRV